MEPIWSLPGGKHPPQSKRRASYVRVQSLPPKRSCYLGPRPSLTPGTGRYFMWLAHSLLYLAQKSNEDRCPLIARTYAWHKPHRPEEPVLG
jgi:hypothetical protein